MHTCYLKYARLHTHADPISVSIVIRLRAGRPELDSQQWQKKGLFFFSTSRPALGPDGYRGIIRRELSDRTVKLTTHLHLVLRLRMCVAIFNSP